jgi:MoaA/NifB/PqqE/SkfB family radical SAM enzyme
MCPRAEVGAGDRSAEAPDLKARDAPGCRDMSVEEFKTIAHYLPEAEHVVLEGWGESTLHPSLVEIAGLARAAGSRVGFVTNGTSLDRMTLSGLIDGGLDFIGFSLAGGTKATHRASRPESDLDVILNTVRLTQELKKERRTERPEVRIVLLLLRDNIRETPLLVRLAADLGVKEIALINLVHIANRRQDDQRVFRYEDENPREAVSGEEDFGAFLSGAEKLAKTLKIPLFRPSLSAHEVAVCEENPLRNIYVSASGDVAPCVFLAPPLASPFKRIFRGEEHLVQKVSFGNIFREPFERIWESGEYRDFRERFHRRKRALEDLYESLLFKRPLQAGLLPATGSLAPPPLPCATCHKLFGL